MRCPTFHQLQVIEYGRLTQRRLLELDGGARPARRRWLLADVRRLRQRAAWHATFGNRRESEPVEAHARAAWQLLTRAANDTRKLRREQDLELYRATLKRAGEIYARERTAAAEPKKTNRRVIVRSAATGVEVYGPRGA